MSQPFIINSEYLVSLLQKQVDEILDLEKQLLYNFFFSIPCLRQRVKPYYRDILKNDIIDLLRNIRIEPKMRGEQVYQSEQQQQNNQVYVLEGSVGLFVPDPDNIYLKNKVLEFTDIKDHQIIYDTDIGDWQYLLTSYEQFVKKKTIQKGEDFGNQKEQGAKSSNIEENNYHYAAIEDSILIYIGWDIYEQFLGSKILKVEMICKTLQNQYNDLDIQIALKMSYLASEQSSKQNIPIYKEGSVPEGIYIVKKGQVSLKKKIVHQNTDNIYNLQIYVVKTGGLFGAEDIQNKKNRVFSTFPEEEGTSLYFIPKADVPKNIILKQKSMRTGEFLGRCIKQQLEYIGFIDEFNQENLKYDSEDKILPLLMNQKENLLKLQEYNLLEYQNLSDAAGQIRFRTDGAPKEDLTEIIESINNHFDRSQNEFQRKRYEQEKNFVPLLKTPLPGFSQQEMSKTAKSRFFQGKQNYKNKYRSSFSNHHESSQQRSSFLGLQDTLQLNQRKQSINNGKPRNTNELSSDSQEREQRFLRAISCTTQTQQKNNPLLKPLSVLQQTRQQQIIIQKMKEKCGKNGGEDDEEESGNRNKKYNDFKLNKLPVTLFMSKEMKEKQPKPENDYTNLFSSTDKKGMIQTQKKLSKLSFTELQQNIQNKKQIVLDTIQHNVRKAVGKKMVHIPLDLEQLEQHNNNNHLHSTLYNRSGKQTPKILIQGNQTNKSNAKPTTILKQGKYQSFANSPLNQLKQQRSNSVQKHYPSSYGFANKYDQSVNQIAAQTQDLSPNSHIQSENGEFYNEKILKNQLQIPKTTLNHGNNQQQFQGYDIEKEVLNNSKESKEDYSSAELDVFNSLKKKNTNQQNAEKDLLSNHVYLSTKLSEDHWLEQQKQTQRDKFFIDKHTNERYLAEQSQQIYKSENRKQVMFKPHQEHEIFINYQVSQSRHQQMLQLRDNYYKKNRNFSEDASKRNLSKIQLYQQQSQPGAPFRRSLFGQKFI